MNILLLLTSTLLTLFIIALFGISDECRQVITYLSVLIFFVLFYNSFKKMINKNKHNSYPDLDSFNKNNIVNKFTNSIYINSNSNNSNNINSEKSKCLNKIKNHNIFLSETKNLIKENEFKKYFKMNMKNILIENGIYPMPIFKNKIDNFKDLHNSNHIKSKTIDSILSQHNYNKSDCTNDNTCVILPLCHN